MADMNRRGFFAALAAGFALRHSVPPTRPLRGWENLFVSVNGTVLHVDDVLSMQDFANRVLSEHIDRLVFAIDIAAATDYIPCGSYAEYERRHRSLLLDDLAVNPLQSRQHDSHVIHSSGETSTS